MEPAQRRGEGTEGTERIGGIGHTVPHGPTRSDRARYGRRPDAARRAGAVIALAAVRGLVWPMSSVRVKSAEVMPGK